MQFPLAIISNLLRSATSAVVQSRKGAAKEWGKNAGSGVGTSRSRSCRSEARVIRTDHSDPLAVWSVTLANFVSRRRCSVPPGKYVR